MKILLLPIHIMTSKTLEEKLKGQKKESDNFNNALIANLTSRSVNAEIQLKIRMGSKR